MKKREPNEFDYYVSEEEKRRLADEAILARINRLSAPLRYNAARRAKYSFGGVADKSRRR